MFQKEEEPPPSESYQGLAHAASFAEPYPLVFFPLLPLSRFSLSSITPHSFSFHYQNWLRLIPNFQVAALVAVAAVVYMRVFLPDSIIDDNLSVPIMSKVKLSVAAGSDQDSNKKERLFKSIPSPDDMVALLKTRLVLVTGTDSKSMVLFVIFFLNLVEDTGV